MATIRTSVVLPAPLGPSNAAIRPGGTVRSTPLSAITFPNAFAAPVTSSMGWVMVRAYAGTPGAAGDEPGERDRRVRVFVCGEIKSPERVAPVDDEN